MSSFYENLLKDINNKFPIHSLKAEYQVENQSDLELVLLKNLASELNLGLSLKIGGCEAFKDMLQASQTGVNSVVAPMIESSYALKKFVTLSHQVFQKENLYINVESVTGFKNIDDIVTSEYFNDISGIVFGRSDFAGSLGMKCSDVECDTVFQHADKISRIAEKYNKEFIVGGNISVLSVPFLKNLSYLTNFETRKIIFDSSALDKSDIKDGIKLAIEFEIEWIKSKNDGKLSSYDEKRLQLLGLRYKL